MVFKHVPPFSFLAAELEMTSVVASIYLLMPFVPAAA